LLTHLLLLLLLLLLLQLLLMLQLLKLLHRRHCRRAAIAPGTATPSTASTRRLEEAAGDGRIASAPSAASSSPTSTFPADGPLFPPEHFTKPRSG
jgi:hypothetical protein